ncbi:UNKNOWN [Stylonychia lemnae]|uniref:Uncharacterized protein n=1 Tax=Stylonychia lemnae TaxID=5949 RepID=A0A078A8X7_STYLE|nr:UNKNOWN [Stylonychia lemnae]|eukprot:CDW77258.1 UNKNOWN [Stylonychia lemnae]
MNPQYLNEHSFTRKGLLENVLAPNGFDGVRAHQDIAQLAKEQKYRRYTGTFLVGNSLLGLFSIFNLTRFGRLSASGKSAAVAGTFICTLNEYVALQKLGFLRTQSVAPAPAQEAQQ